MRDTVFANCESDFVVAAIRKKKRLDGRLFDELRNIELHFGSDYGCAYVTLGETKVLAQVSCELGEPRNARKNEGNLFVNVEINDMVCGVFETGHQGHLGVHTNRLIEKCIKDSRCVDLEALCIISEEQAWEIRVDVSVLNYDGNLFTCCSLAALAALAHFKTPHVSIENSEVRIESIREHEPEPLSLHHYPILVAFAIFGEGDDILLDPTELEEQVCESELVIGMNSFRELCGMHFSGRTTGNRLLIVKAAQQAAIVAADLVKLMKSKLEKDKEERNKNRGKTEGLVSAIHLDRILSASQDRNSLRVTMREIEETARLLISEHKTAVTGKDSDNEQGQQSDGEESENEEMEVAYSKDRRLGTQLPPMEKLAFGEKWIPSGNRNAWALPNATLSDDGSDASEGDEVGYVKTITDEDRIIDRIELNDSEEEEDTVMLGAKEAAYNRVPDESADKCNLLQVTPKIESHDCDRNAVCRLDKPGLPFVCDSSSYSMTSPSYSSGSSLHSTSSSSRSYALRKPNYNPPNWDWSQPSTSCGRIPTPDKTRKRAPRPVYSPSSPSSDSSTSHHLRHSDSLLLFGEQREKTRNSPRYTRTSKRSRNKSYLETRNNNQSNHKLSRLNRHSKKYKIKSKLTSKNKIEQARQVASDFLANKHKTERVPYSYSVTRRSPAGCLTLDGMSSGQADNYSLALHPVPSLTYSPSSTSKPPPPVLVSADSQRPGSPVYVPSSPASSPTSPVYSSQTRPPKSSVRRLSFSPSPSSKLHQPHSDSNTADDPSPVYSGSLSKQTPPCSSKPFRSPVYSTSSPSPSYSPTSCPYSSPKYSPSSKKRHYKSHSNLSCTESPNQVIPSPTYSPSSPSKQPPSCPESGSTKLPHSPVYSPSSPSLPHSPTSSPKNPSSRKKQFLYSLPSKPCPPSLSGTVPSSSFCTSSPSKAPPSPTYSPSSPSYLPSHSMSSPSKAPPSPDFTPSSPSKPPPSPSLSPSFHSSPSTSSQHSPSQTHDNLNNELMTYLERKAPSPQFPGSPSTAGSSSLYSPVSSQSPVYSSDSSSKQNKMLKKRVKLQRSSPTSPGSVVSELMEIGASKSNNSKKLELYSPSNSPTLPCTFRAHQSGNGSPEVSMPSPKYSPSSKMISSDISEAVVPPYSPSSPSHPPPSPSISPSSPPSPVSSDSYSLSKVKADCTPELTTQHKPPSYGSPHYSLDSLSSYSSSSFSPGLPSPSSGSPRYSPSPSESEALLNHQLSPSPPLSPAVAFMSPRVSSSSSSSPARETPSELSDPPHYSQGTNLPRGVALPGASLSMFSPSVSPQLSQFSPSSPSHQPPSPSYSPSSPSYSSGSCSPPESISSGHLGNTFFSSPRSSRSSTSTEPSTVVLKLFIPKST